MESYKAALSFGNFRQGRWYDLDPEDPQVKGLLGAGYLIPTVDVPASGAELFNGQGEVESGAGEDDSDGADDSTGGADDESDQ